MFATIGRFAWMPRMLGFFLVSACCADTVTLKPVADATLFEANPNNNLGDGTSVQAGLRPHGGRTRALFRFDLSTLPEGAEITSATFQISVTRTPGGAANSSFSLNRLLVNWGEGNKTSGGGGAQAVAGQVTWNNRFFGGETWGGGGGKSGVDFLAAASGSTAIAGNGIYKFSSAGILADVQAWRADPTANDGWIFRSDAESVSRTIRRFGSRESGSSPLLILEYTVVPEPQSWALAAVGIAGLVLSSRCRRWVAERR